MFAEGRQKVFDALSEKFFRICICGQLQQRCRHNSSNATNVEIDCALNVNTETRALMVFGVYLQYQMPVIAVDATGIGR